MENFNWNRGDPGHPPHPTPQYRPGFPKIGPSTPIPRTQRQPLMVSQISNISSHRSSQNPYPQGSENKNFGFSRAPFTAPNAPSRQPWGQPTNCLRSDPAQPQEPTSCQKSKMLPMTTSPNSENSIGEGVIRCIQQSELAMKNLKEEEKRDYERFKKQYGINSGMRSSFARNPRPAKYRIPF